MRNGHNLFSTYRLAFKVELPSTFWDSAARVVAVSCTRPETRFYWLYLGEYSFLPLPSFEGKLI